MKSKYLNSALLISGLILMLIAIDSFGTTNEDFYKKNHKGEEVWKSVTLHFSPIALNNILEESFETAEFQINPKLKGLFHLNWIPSHLDSRSNFINSLLFKKSIPLFDVKTTYFHFFYSW
ncbi:hypothetical protein [Algoriphagus sp.]|uniref:hypothetical protein n=1 Tax=Algoriphagus sp. TaxID=1872435 RepID=UPI0025D80836|nr:hypothetical protein [Algoriphagus sp.]